MYTLQDNDEGDCRCGKELSILVNREFPDGYPAFLICFGCRTVVEVSGDNGETVVYKGGRRKKYTSTSKNVPTAAKRRRLQAHQAAKRETVHE